jgi:polyribonucleotide nucleotidyltransferase
VRPIRGPARRDIGHGALAEKALLAVIPSEDEFPYTIRLVSEVLSSNGSTSMASVCGSTLALMDAGVQIKEPVAGIAMGLVKENDKEVILSDIQGVEDGFGDMDFKIAGTKNGITAIQLDVKKKEGLPLETLSSAIFQAKEGRNYILEEMLKVIDKPRKEPSKYAPRIFMLNIPVEKIGDLIGPGGKTIKKIIEETEVKIDIDDREGKVYIYSSTPENGEKAKKMVESITREIKVGDTFVGKITRIADFGVFVEILPNKEGLIHISELSHGYVSRIEDIVKVGEEILVKVIKIDEFGRIQLSRKAVIPPPPPKNFRRRY